MTTLTLQQKIGQRLVIGFPSTVMSEDFIAMVRQYKIANVILFRENIESCEQLKLLCSQIQQLVKHETGHCAFITIDQEGGVVTRLPENAVNAPSAMAIAATGKPQNAYDAGLITANELLSLGVNFNLAPSMDVNCNPDNPIIGVRSYGDTAEKVLKYALPMIKGMQDGGLLCAAKHFPGHGDTNTDSHLALPCVDKTESELYKTELAPFEGAIKAGISAIMSTHILFPALEPTNVPATMSRTIMRTLLRKKMGFEGLTISDCMEMQAVQKSFGTINGVVAAVDAGVDLIFISHSTLLARDAANAIAAALLNDELSIKEMDESVSRILKFKAPYENNLIVSFDKLVSEAAVDLMIEKSITEVNVPPSGRVLLGASPLCIGCTPFRTGLVGNIADNVATFPELISPLLNGEAMLITPDPSEDEINAAVIKASAHTCAVVGTYNGHLHITQLTLIERLCAANIPVIAIALRNPYDLAMLPREVYSLAAYAYTAKTISAVANVLLNKKEAHGYLPVKLIDETKVCV